MRRHIFRVDGERSLELVDRLLPEAAGLVLAPLPSPEPAQIEQCLPEQVDHLIVVAEVKATVEHVVGTVLQGAAQVDDRLFKAALLTIDVSAQPGPGPTRKALG